PPRARPAVLVALPPPRVPGRRHRPAARADHDLPGAALSERRPGDRRARGDDTRGGLRLRGARGRHPREEPHDGQLASGMLRLRAPCRARGGREGERMTTTVDTDLYGAVEDA